MLFNRIAFCAGNSRPGENDGGVGYGRSGQLRCRKESRSRCGVGILTVYGFARSLFIGSDSELTSRLCAESAYGVGKGVDSSNLCPVAAVEFFDFIAGCIFGCRPCKLQGSVGDVGNGRGCRLVRERNDRYACTCASFVVVSGSYAQLIFGCGCKRNGSCCSFCCCDNLRSVENLIFLCAVNLIPGKGCVVCCCGSLKILECRKGDFVGEVKGCFCITEEINLCGYGTRIDKVTGQGNNIKISAGLERVCFAVKACFDSGRLKRFADSRLSSLNSYLAGTLPITATPM